jgi:hypothetical protein
VEIQVYPPNPKSCCLNVPAPPAVQLLQLGVFVAEEKALICTKLFKVPEVELYHTCPSVDVFNVGSEAKYFTRVPLIPEYSDI